MDRSDITTRATDKKSPRAALLSIATLPFALEKPDTRCGLVDVFQPDAGYDQQAVPAVREQLAKAGVRLPPILRNGFR